MRLRATFHMSPSVTHLHLTAGSPNKRPEVHALHGAPHPATHCDRRNSVDKRMSDRMQSLRKQSYGCYGSLSWSSWSITAAAVFFIIFLGLSGRAVGCPSWFHCLLGLHVDVNPSECCWFRVSNL